MEIPRRVLKLALLLAMAIATTACADDVRGSTSTPEPSTASAKAEPSRSIAPPPPVATKVGSVTNRCVGQLGGDLPPAHGVDIKSVDVERTDDDIVISWAFHSIKDTGEQYESLDELDDAGRDPFILAFNFASLSGNAEGTIAATHPSGGSWSMTYQLRGENAETGTLRGTSLEFEALSATMTIPISISQTLESDFQWSASTAFGLTVDGCPAERGIGN